MLLALNPRMETIRGDWQSLKGFSDTYSAAAHDILRILDAASTTSTTITKHAAALDALLLNVIGLSQAGIDLLGAQSGQPGPSDQLVGPDRRPADEVQPGVHVSAVGCQVAGRQRPLTSAGGNGKSAVVDASVLLGDDPYRYPDNLPIVAAKGGPGGKPGCGSLPDVTKNFPVRQLITNTGWGTGTDIRPNPGIGHPVLRELLPGHPGGARAAEHPRVPAGPGDWPGALPGRAAVRGAAVRAGRHPAVAGCAAAAGVRPTAGAGPEPGPDEPPAPTDRPQP